MEVYIYTVTDRQTGEELFKGLAGQCAKFLSCSEDYVRTLAKQKVAPEITRYSHLNVERRLGDMPPVKCEGCGAVIPNAGNNRRFCAKCNRLRSIERSQKRYQEQLKVQQQAAGDCLDVPQTHYAVILFFAYMGEQEDRKRKGHIAMFSISCAMYLLAEVIAQVMC